MALTTKDVTQIGDEMSRVLEPVYEDLDELKGDMKVVKKQLGEISDKVDALTGDVIDLPVN